MSTVKQFVLLLACPIVLILLAGCAAQSMTTAVEKTNERSEVAADSRTGLQTYPFFGWTFPTEEEPNRQRVRHLGSHMQLREQGHLRSYWACLQGEVFLYWHANAVETLDEDMVEIESACEDTYYLDFDYRLEEERVVGQLHINRFHPYRAYWSMPLELRVGEVAKRTFHPPGHKPVTAVFTYELSASVARIDE